MNERADSKRRIDLFHISPKNMWDIMAHILENGRRPPAFTRPRKDPTAALTKKKSAAKKKAPKRKVNRLN